MSQIARWGARAGLFALIGCQPTPSSPLDLPDPPADSGWDGGASAPEIAATWTSDEAMATAEAGLSLGFPSPWSMADAMIEWFGRGDLFCPGTDAVMSDTTLQGCQALTGWYFLGIGGQHVIFEEDETGLETTAWLMGDMEIIGPEGETMAVGGHWDHLLVEADGVETWEGELSGTWYAAPEDAGWLTSGISALLWFSGARDAETGARQEMRLHGGLSMGGATMYFDELTWGADCDQPTGTLRVRDPSGAWFYKDYSSDCNPCGPVVFHGEQVSDESCLDLSGLAAAALETAGP